MDDTVVAENDNDQAIDNNKKQYINILLIGETGVGKSTFINSLANYVSYKFIDRLENEKLHVLIPVIYKIKDKDNVEHEVNLSSECDNNEFLDVGASATQCVKSYNFGIYEGRVRVRIIDTPGTCDTRGISQDEINTEQIITYIKHLDNIHGICFLLKPTKTRVTVDFEYSLMQLLSRLDKSACKNLVFIFTNTRGSDYGPGESLSVLQTVIRKIGQESDVDIPLNNNIFCFDNEAFKYLAAKQKNINFNKKIEENYRKSWEFSAKQCWSLIRYLSQRITPYLPYNLITVNVARNMMLQLSKIHTDISQLLLSSDYVLDRIRDNRNSKIAEIEELKSIKFNEVTDVEKIKLPTPNLVCTSTTCAQVYKVGPEYKWQYKVCHRECTEVVEAEYETTGCPELNRCILIDKSTQNCLECGCQFQLHMQIDYETRIAEGYVENESVDKCISEKDMEIRELMKKINVVSSKQEGLKHEREVIQKVSVKLAQYLKVNAVASFTDSYKEYILYSINQQENLGNSSNSDTIDDLKTLIENFEQTKRTFKEVSNIDTLLNWEDIEENVQSLYKLSLNGNTIRTVYEQLNGKNYNFQIDDYVHGAVFKKKSKEGTKITKKEGRQCPFEKETLIPKKEKCSTNETKKPPKDTAEKNNAPKKETGSENKTEKVSVEKRDKAKQNKEITKEGKKITKKEGRQYALEKETFIPKKEKCSTNETKKPPKDTAEKNKSPKNLTKSVLKNLTAVELQELLDELRIEKANKTMKGPKPNNCKKGGGVNTPVSSQNKNRTAPPPYSSTASGSYYRPQYNYPQPSYSYGPHEGYFPPPYNHAYQGYNSSQSPQPEPKDGKTYEITLKLPVPEKSSLKQSSMPYAPPLMSLPPQSGYMPPHPHAPQRYPNVPPTYSPIPPPPPPQQYNFGPPPQHYNSGPPPPPHTNFHPSQGSHAVPQRNRNQTPKYNNKNLKDAKKGPKEGKPQFKPKKPHK